MTAPLHLPRLALLLSVALAACSGGDSITRPAAPADLSTTPAVGNPLATRHFPHSPSGNAFGHLAQCSRRAEKRGTAVIGSSGGILKVGSDYLVVPAGALQSRIKITGTVIEGTAAEIRLEPEGLHFTRAATLLIDASGCDIDRRDDPALLYLGDDGTLLERIDATYDPASGWLAAPIRHFSVYAVGV